MEGATSLWWKVVTAGPQTLFVSSAFRSSTNHSHLRSSYKQCMAEEAVVSIAQLYLNSLVPVAVTLHKVSSLKRSLWQRLE